MTLTDQLRTYPETGLGVGLSEGDLSIVYGGLRLEDEKRRKKAFAKHRFTDDQREAIYSSGALEALIAEVQGDDSDWVGFRLESVQTGYESDSLIVCCRGFNRQRHKMEHLRIIKPAIEAILPQGYSPDQIRSLADSVLPEGYIPPYRENEFQPYLTLLPF